ncbi:uncharacterized protein MONOS_4088 [Monocercomonoides exilis]|uniref:uncharacterized protein n=1 Tax=Monocercomonoides exilis TaxID=2049356 RepID=UPI003559872A|nr:hypothetical protein MONOS_4088 [Monocercomonoides exilis]|eukprot:MONOS_4088.1-p1 / transcript=MONOS_4088.1 / gene=MONOS_4088 / organism=Monocercomonoides_exilis_PA203 / gene_product=unspecified product / transcript_product=unspecified product / location=Mono_scaffold00104:36106-36429(-) / protein_length=108 / sequence_SO=supercontig / SO=protein_coding / is_pseudo=false
MRRSREQKEQAGNFKETLNNCPAIMREHVSGSVFAGVFDAETKLMGLVEEKQAEWQAAKVAVSFYESVKRLIPLQEYILRRQMSAEQLVNTLYAQPALMHSVVTQET